MVRKTIQAVPAPYIAPTSEVVEMELASCILENSAVDYSNQDWDIFGDK